MDLKIRHYAPGKDNHPVTYVHFNDAAAFCKWGGYRLPTNRMWEKAARGTDNSRTCPWGEDWQEFEKVFRVEDFYSYNSTIFLYFS